MKFSNFLNGESRLHTYDAIIESDMSLRIADTADISKYPPYSNLP